MAPISATAAKLAYDKSANQLKRACTSLERHLPPSGDDAETQVETPSLIPRRRLDSVPPGCALCVSELMDLEPGDREGHQCNHKDQRARGQDEDAHSTAGSDSVPARARIGRSKQPALGVVKEYLGNIEVCLDKFTDAVTVLCSTLNSESEREMYQDHLIVWIDHVEEIKDRAREVITVLEAAQFVESRRQTVAFNANNGTEASSQTDQANPAQVTSSINLPGTSNLASGSIPPAGLSDTMSTSCTVPQSAPFIASVGTTLDPIQSLISSLPL